MDDTARDNAIRILLEEQAEPEDRIKSAEHLGSSSSEQAYDALKDLCKRPDGNA